MSVPGNHSVELLRELADGDLSRLETPEYQHPTAYEVAGLDAETYQLVGIAALAAVDAPPVAWFMHLAGYGTTIQIEKVVGVLLAVSPLVGIPRVIAAASNVIGATDLAEELEEP